MGYGVKESDGFFTGDLAVRVYVTEKVPKQDLLRRFRVPEFINGVATDVIAVGKLQFQNRPATIGTSISHFHGRAGSLGCVLSKAGDNAWYLLSASHVLLPGGGGTQGDKIMEPAVPVGIDPIATLEDFEPLQFGGAENRFDAAIARVIRKTDVSLEIPKIGPLIAKTMDAALYQSVRKFGAATAHTLGIVTDLAADVHITSDGEDYLFSDVLEVTGFNKVFSQGGDSGSLVVDVVTTHSIGLVIGGASGDLRTYVSPMNRILTRFTAEIAQ